MAIPICGLSLYKTHMSIAYWYLLHCMWLVHQRSQHNVGKLREEKVEELDAAFGDDWKTTKRSVLTFEQNLQRMKAFIQANGNVPTRRQKDADGVKLGVWVHNRRKEYREGVLTEERIAALEAVLQWSWVSEHDNMCSFEDNVELLKEFVQETGRLPSAREKGLEPERINLGRWVVVRRMEKREGKLSPEKVAALEGVPGWVWDPTASPPKAPSSS